MLSRLVLFSSVCLLPLAAMAQTPPATPSAAPAAAPAIATPAVTDPNNAPITRAQLPALIKDVLLNDPDIVMQAAQKYREKQEAEMRLKTEESVKKNHDAVYDPSAPSAGAADADVVVVEFFDYHCGYCKHLLPDLTRLIEQDKKVRVIFRELPILSEDSVTGAKAALAVNAIAKDKYFAFHTALMQTSGKIDDKAIAAAAKKAGVNPDKLKTEMAKQEYADKVEANRKLASDLQIGGTPAIIIGDQLFPGALPYEDLAKLVGMARLGQKPTLPDPSAPETPAAAKP